MLFNKWDIRPRNYFRQTKGQYDELIVSGWNSKACAFFVFLLLADMPKNIIAVKDTIILGAV